MENTNTNKIKLCMQMHILISTVTKSLKAKADKYAHEITVCVLDFHLMNEHTTVLPIESTTNSTTTSTTQKSTSDTTKNTDDADNEIEFKPDETTTSKPTITTTTEKETTSTTATTTETTTKKEIPPATDKDGWITKWY